MSEQSKASNKPSAQPVEDLPANLPEELAPIYDWWRTQGSQFLIGLCVVVIVLATAVVFIRYRAQQTQTASAALTNADTLESLETLAGQHGGTKLGPIIRIKLAKAQYDAGRYDAALASYDAFLQAHAGHAMSDMALLGRAHTLEALNNTTEALQVYDAFAAANPDHYLAPEALMGKARCLAIAGQKAEAVDILERLAVAQAGTQWEEAARSLKTVVDRFQGLKTESLLDRISAMALTEDPKTNAPPALTPLPEPLPEPLPDPAPTPDPELVPETVPESQP